MIHDNPQRATHFISGPFAELCSLAEFAELHGVDESAIRHAIKSGKFRIGIDCMKFGKQWVMSKQAFHSFDGNYSKFSIECVNCRNAIKAANEKTATQENHTLP
jgi:hypothetical protein